jgi:hypothetical protein
VESVKAFRSIIRTQENTIAQAQHIYRELARENEWQNAEDFGDSGAALCLLDRLELIRVRFENNVIQIRMKKKAL